MAVEGAAEVDRCFCCLENDGNLHTCTCSCKTLFACVPCFFKIVCEGPTCTVCRASFSDASVIRVCEWALESVRTKPVFDEARHSVEIQALRVMLPTGDGASAFARVHELAVGYQSVLGIEHEATLHMKLLSAFALIRQEVHHRAYEQITEIENALVEKWQEAPAAWEKLMYTAKQQKAFCLWHMRMRLVDTDSLAETEYRSLLRFMTENGVFMSMYYLATYHTFARFMKIRVDELFAEQTARRQTRAGKALWLRATEVVVEAHSAHAFAYGPEHEYSRGLHADTVTLQSYCSSQ